MQQLVIAEHKYKWTNQINMICKHNNLPPVFRWWYSGGGDRRGKEAHQCYHFSNDGGCRRGKNPIVMELCLFLYSWYYWACTSSKQLIGRWVRVGVGFWRWRLAARFEYFILVKEIDFKTPLFVGRLCVMREMELMFEASDLVGFGGINITAI